MKLQIIIDNEFMSRIDVYCTSRGYTRSEFVRQAIREKLLPVPNNATQTIATPFRNQIDPIVPSYIATSASTKAETFQELKDKFNEPIYSKEEL